MDYLRLASIFCAAFVVAFGAIGPALAEGRAVAAAMEAIARQPEAYGVIRQNMLLGFALAEALALIGFVVPFVFGA